LEGQKWKNI